MLPERPESAGSGWPGERRRVRMAGSLPDVVSRLTSSYWIFREPFRTSVGGIPGKSMRGGGVFMKKFIPCKKMRECRVDGPDWSWCFRHVWIPE